MTTERRTSRAPQLSFVVGLALAVLALAAGTGALSDNSFLTHLATGRLIWAGEGLPRHDPYTFTAAGEPWVVQSWGASVVYGLVDRVAGLGGLRILTGALYASVTACGWALTRPAGTILGRLGAAAPFLAVGLGTWSERPYLFALVWTAVVLLAAEGRVNPVMLFAVGWAWVNTHGSWPLGLVALASIAAGAFVDREETSTVTRALAWLLGGCIAGVASPYGVGILTFPLDLLRRREALRNIVEWQAPTFQSAGELAFLTVICVVVVGIVRVPRWRSAIPMLVFLPLALTGARNIAMAALVLLPAAATGMAGIGSIDGGRRARPLRALGAAFGVFAVLVLARVATTDHFDDEPYPVAADAWLRRHELAPPDARVITHDFVGNWWEARFLDDAGAFVDDRVEVLPEEVAADYVALLQGDDRWEEILDSYDPDAVLWADDQPLAQLLEADDDWKLSFAGGEFQVFTPAG